MVCDSIPLFTKGNCKCAACSLLFSLRVLINSSLVIKSERAKLEEIHKDHRVNFAGGDPTNSHLHHNGNTTAIDSGYNNNYSIPPPRKRPWGTSPDQVDVPGHVKVYVAPVPRTATEADVRLVFEGHGNIVEVVLLRDKLTGARQGSCFVKYSTFNEADTAIKALSNQYTFPGESYPVVVRFADRELERFGVRGFSRNLEKKGPPEEVVVDKVFVCYINKDASRQEIEEIFSPYGHVEHIFIMRNRGCCFVKFSNKEMALAAIKGLDRNFTMRGCDHPLIVRFADPKKPRTGESRGNYLPANVNYGPNSQEPAAWPPPNFCDSNTGGVHITPHHSRLPHQQVIAPMPNWEPGATVVQQQFLPQQVNSQFASMHLRSIRAPNLSSPPFLADVQRQFHPADSSVQNIEQQLNFQLPTQSERNSNTVAGSTSPDLPTNPQDEEFPECDWSEHYSPDGHKYYYNCVTCESRWEKPEEYALYDKESQKQHEQDDHSVLHSQSSLSSSQEVSQKQQETNHDHMQSETSPVVGQV